MYNFDCSFVRSGAPIITFSSTGLAFNAIARNMLQYPAEMDVGYDETANTIGIGAHRPENAGKPYEFEIRQKDGWVRISCRDFMGYLSNKWHRFYKGQTIYSRICSIYGNASCHG